MGKVVDNETGESLTGARVSLGQFTGLTGIDGKYRIFCKSGSYNFSVSMDGFEIYEDLMKVNKNQYYDVHLIRAGYVAQPTPPASESAVITGKITNLKTGHPVGDVSVWINYQRAFTRSDGVYSLNVDLGSYTLKIDKEGYTTETASITVTEEKTYSVDKTLTPIPIIKVTVDPSLLYTREQEYETEVTGVVTKADGTPAIGATVHFESKGDVPGIFDSSTVITDTMGRVTVKWNCRTSSNYINKGYWPRQTWTVFLNALCTIGNQTVESRTFLYVQPEACHYNC